MINNTEMTHHALDKITRMPITSACSYAGQAGGGALIFPGMSVGGCRYAIGSLAVGHTWAAGCDQAADAREAPRIEVLSIEQARGSGERPLAVGCGGILARELGQVIPLRGGVLSGWCQHPWPGILAAR